MRGLGSRVGLVEVISLFEMERETENGNIGCMIFFFQAEDGIRDDLVTGVQTCALPIWGAAATRNGQYKKRGRCRKEIRAVQI